MAQVSRVGSWLSRPARSASWSCRNPWWSCLGNCGGLWWFRGGLLLRRSPAQPASGRLCMSLHYLQDTPLGCSGATFSPQQFGCRFTGLEPRRHQDRGRPPQSRRCPGLGGHLRETDPRPPGPGGRGRGLGSRKKPRGQHHRPGDPLLGHGNLGVFREGPAHRLPHRPDVMSSPVFTRRLPHSLPEGSHPTAHVGRSRTPGCRAPRGSSQLVRV